LKFLSSTFIALKKSRPKLLRPTSFQPKGAIVKLRNHPLMVRRSGFACWPPYWWTPRQKEIVPAGEVGTLQSVRMDWICNKLFLMMEHDDLAYLGVLQFDDICFCQHLHDILNENLGRSMAEIGDLDLGYLV
jgi:hypothetical protein